MSGRHTSFMAAPLHVQLGKSRALDSKAAIGKPGGSATAVQSDPHIMAPLGHESQSNPLEHLLDSIPSLIHTSRPDGYLDYFNQRWLDYVGLPIEAILGWNWTVAIHPEDVDAIVERWRFSLATGQPFSHEARVRRADGRYR